MDNLHHRRRNVTSGCPYCVRDGENTKHAMLTCPFARQVWALSHLPWHVISSGLGSSEAWVRTIHSKFDRDQYALFLVICWNIWSSRNKFLWENQVLNAADVVISANSFLLDFHKPTPSRLVLLRGCNSATQWCKPPPGTIKWNFDVALFKEIGNAGIGIIARDPSGNRVAHSFARLVSLFPSGFAAIPDSVGTLISADIVSFD
ncbi:hypothetical protein BUALT_Bualt10G0039400 [Buddleja alternifolia]|uniref:Reverse transcriptase zinc-binding domain-containing protein n=1 Tax=Buddleja alternifolia TaxID=168488 RepID=A0AAV6WXM4_9LAMI|nr:hypothetical protein BUALT_Bualt10G0039400 [Buddleja alternifolia]